MAFVLSRIARYLLCLIPFVLSIVFYFSAIQLVSSIVDRVDSLFVYGRSPVYISPQFDSPFSEITKALFHRLLQVHWAFVLFWSYIMDSTYLLCYRLTWHSALHRGLMYFVTWLHRLIQVSDPALRAKLVPDQLLRSKRTALRVPTIQPLEMIMWNVSGKRLSRCMSKP